MRARVLVARQDSDGDVLLAGPAVRAVRAGAAHVTLLVGPRGQQAARLLPGVDDVIVWRCPWIDATPPPVRRDDIDALVDQLAAGRYDEALVLTSFHQSPLPTALLLRMAGVRRIAAASEDCPGALLDIRHRLPETGLHEVRRALSTAAALGHRLPPDDDGRPAVRRPLPECGHLTGPGPHVVLHPGTSVPARGWPADRFAELGRSLTGRGLTVLVTGGPDETALTAAVSAAIGTGTGTGTANGRVVDLGGCTDLGMLAAVLERAVAVVVANTGPAHLAAAVGTAVVSLFAPTVPAERWAPYTDRRVLLGDQSVPCAGCRARECPVPGHPCLTAVTPADALAAVDALLAVAAPRAPGETGSGTPAPPAAVNTPSARSTGGSR